MFNMGKPIRSYYRVCIKTGREYFDLPTRERPAWSKPKREALKAAGYDEDQRFPVTPEGKAAAEALCAEIEEATGVAMQAQETSPL